jgi:hypothetical protein
VGAAENGCVAHPLRADPIRFCDLTGKPLFCETLNFGWSMTMKLIRLLAVTAIFATPFPSFAQSNSHVTRESVREELIELQKAGYNPASDEAQYPRNIEAVEALLHAQDHAAANSYGPAAAGTSEAGAPKAGTSIPGFDSVYARP